MLLKLFKSNQQLVLVFLPVIFLPVLYASIMEAPNYMAENVLNGSLFGQYSLNINYTAAITIGYVIWVLQAFMVNSIFNAAQFSKRDNQLPALLFLLARSYDYGHMAVSGPEVGFLICLIGVRLLIYVRRDIPALRPVFVFGVCVGLASWFFLPAGGMLLYSLLFLLLIRPFKWREYLGPLIGLSLIGAYIAYVWSFEMGKPDISALVYSSQKNVWLYSENKELVFVFAVALLFGMLAGATVWLREFLNSTMRFKNLSRGLVIGTVLLGGIHAMLYKGHLPNHLSGLIAMGFALTGTHLFFAARRAKLKEAMMVLMYGVLIANLFV